MCRSKYMRLGILNNSSKNKTHISRMDLSASCKT
jgi:hypothetical protein